ncbi:sulfurtransferase [Nesterenkonia alkaliphila]|uniref:Sulfurtransferase n=1 Tax=Nesterenkonia alkaliphila TaxID=1463631 RepID=A0A7K1ULC7_9MICC|nr:sulfurtransferase [Nesterenkonia alkaliphila]MVT27236.1 sulfurtransferase [Nesterenkonia alkaliphila]GFZ78385.1 sulfurtransferase [Nesterenkonia alkaliphila]
MGHLISPEDLHELISAEKPGLRILDVRWRLDRPDGRPDYLEGHLPGAVYVDLDTELAEHGLPLTQGRHPLPSRETLQSAARRWGLHDGDTVVVYDDMKNTSSARAWWLLRHAGVADVRVLDGSLRGWVSAGYPLETGDVVPSPGSITLDYGQLEALSIDEAAAFPERGTLLDSRLAQRYRGEVEPMDPRPGHIPGALNAPTAENVDGQGRFLSPELLRERFLALGVDPQRPVASYCGSGINGAHSCLALELGGFEAVLYPGSFSEWSNNYDRPVVTGDTP